LQFQPNFYILGALVTISLTGPCQIARETVHTWSTLPRQISCECVHCVGFWWPKTTILDKFWHLGDSCIGGSVVFARWRQCAAQSASAPYRCCPLLSRFDYVDRRPLFALKISPSCMGTCTSSSTWMHQLPTLHGFLRLWPTTKANIPV